MYSLEVVELKVVVQFSLQMLGGCLVGNVVSQTLFLDRAVKAFNMGIVVRSPESGVPREHSMAPEHLLKVPTELRAIVSLDHGKVKAPFIPGMQYHVGSQPGQDTRMYLGIGHPGIHINDGIDIPSGFSDWADVMNRIRFNQFTRLGYMRTPGVVWTNSFLPSAVKAVVPSQNTAHTAQTDLDTVRMGEVIPNHLGTTFQFSADLQDTCYQLFTNCLWAMMRPSGESRYTPDTGSKPKDCTSCPGWPVVVGKLDMLIELVPFLLPAVNGAAMYPTAISYHLEWCSLANEQLHSSSSRFR